MLENNNASGVAVSVIIPCYNQGKYIGEAIQSVLASTYTNFEIIVVNDGSTNFLTNEILKTQSWPKTKIYNITNQGVSFARNFGIKNSRGKYILPLDADDKISKDYIADSIAILDSNPKVKIVFCQVEMFGIRKGRYRMPEHSMEMLLGQNTMVCSSIFRRDDFNRTNGYNPNMRYGFEDWDFWLSLLGEGGDVYRIPRVHFYYRIKRRSRNADFAKKTKQLREMRYQIYQNHKELYSKYFFDPTKSFEYYLIQNSKEYKVGKAILKPVRYFLNLLTFIEDKNHQKENSYLKTRGQ